MDANTSFDNAFAGSLGDPCRYSSYKRGFLSPCCRLFPSIAAETAETAYAIHSSRFSTGPCWTRGLTIHAVVTALLEIGAPHKHRATLRSGDPDVQTLLDILGTVNRQWMNGDQAIPSLKMSQLQLTILFEVAAYIRVSETACTWSRRPAH